MVPLNNVEFLEHLGHIIGEAVYRFGIEEERSRLASALESTAEGVVITEPSSGLIQYVNRAFEQITGYTKDELLGHKLHLLDSGRQGAQFYQELRESILRDGVWRGQMISKKKDGTLYNEDCTVSPVKGPLGEILNYVSLKRDVTEKLRLESIAESVNTMESIGYIFSGVRHEIGNPINSVNMLLGLLSSKLPDLSQDAIRDYLDRIIGQIGRVEFLLRSLKSFNMYETQAPQNLGMALFMEQFVPLVKDDLETKGIAFDITMDPQVERLYADPRALQQVLLNLITNATDAVHERDQPRIIVRISRSESTVRIEVEDNGCGIPEDKIKDLFKPFYTTKAAGTGLGLVIVKKMITRMNGTITLESRRDIGTIVTISLPEGLNEER
jgi:PAS domain S-box-containing protein